MATHVWHRSIQAGLPTLAVIVLVLSSCGPRDAAESTATSTAPNETTVPSTSSVAPTPETDAPITTELASEPELSVSHAPVSYAFPAGLLDLDWMQQPTQVQGVLGVPDGPGPYPVAVIMHGSHPVCVDEFNSSSIAATAVISSWPVGCPDGSDYVRSDAGLSYIVDALNKRGVAAVSIDVNAAFVWWGGEVPEQAAIAAIFSTHISILERLNNGDDLGLAIESLEGRLDLSRLSVIGHSRGGGHAVALFDSIPELASSIASIVMIEPEPAFVESPVSVPAVLLIRGQCDEDVGPDAGKAVLEELIAAGAKGADLSIPGAGHRMLNTSLIGSSCPGEIDAALAQQQVASAVSSFVASSFSDASLVIEVRSDTGAVLDLGSSSIELIEVSTGLTVVAGSEVPLRVSTTAVLEPLPADADYSAALTEDF